MSNPSIDTASQAPLFQPYALGSLALPNRIVMPPMTRSRASQPGDVGIMVRYQSKVAVFRATVPLGAPVQHLPVAKNFIDETVFKKLKRIGLPPSETCDDATFIRRVTLDLAGRLPSADETTAFLADKSAAKRDALVDRLLASGDYADYFANFWGALLRNQRSSVNGRTEPYMRGTFAFHAWIRDSLANNKPYDQFAQIGRAHV